MYIDNIFEEIKEKLVRELERTTMTDFNKYSEWAKPHYKIIEQLIELKELNYVIDEVKDVTTKLKAVEPIVIEPIEQFNEEPIEEDNYPIGHTFTFIKKAFGGVIKEMNYPIPEELVRVLHMENENKLMIVGIKGKFDDGTPIYDFQIIDRTNTPNPALAEITSGIVIKLRNKWAVKRTVTGMFTIDNKPVILTINDRDAKRFNIQEGDIINGRFYTNNVMNSFRVTYKYDVESKDSDTSIEMKKLQYRQNNSNEPTEMSTTMMDRLDKTSFLNKRILLVGLSSRMNDFKASLDKVDEINFTHLSGYEHKTATRSQIFKSDIVLLSTQENSHDITKFVATICNELKVPFTSTSNDGLFSVLMDAKELIEQQAGISKGA